MNMIALADPVGASSRRRGRPAADASQPIDEAQLLSVAFAMFAEQGFEAATVRDMSRKLGISHNLLNVRFGRKSDLWKAAVDWRLAQASRDVEIAFDRHAPAELRLRELVSRFCEWAMFHSDIVAISYQEGQRASWRLEYIVERFILPFQKRLDGLIEEVRQVRPVAPLSSGALLALLVHGVGSYFALRPLQAQLVPPGVPLSAARSEEAQALAAFLIGGLLRAG
jgi:TetR/AcrR family transcriptional regulator